MILDEIIDSTDNVRDVSSKLTNKIGIGVPIGNYLSQYFANLYLSELDHLCKEELKCKFYYRYADDIVILSDDKDFLHKVLIYIKLLIMLSILELILLEMVKLIMPIVEIKLYFILYIDLIIFLLILKLLNMIGVFMLKIEKKKLNLKHNIL